MSDRNIVINQGNYNENIEGDVIQTNVTQVHVSEGDNVGGSINVTQQTAKQVVNIDKAEGLHIGDIIQENVYGQNVSQVALSNVQVGGDINIKGIKQSVEQRISSVQEGIKTDMINNRIQRAANRGWAALTKRATQIQKSGAFSTNVQVGGDLEVNVPKKQGDTVFLNEEETPELDETLRINIDTLVEMVKLSTVNMPVDASRIERFVIANEIVERIEKNPDLVELCKESPDGIKAALNIKLGDGYKTLVTLIVDEIVRS